MAIATPHDPTLKSLLAEGRAAWPGFELAEEIFMQQAGRALGDGPAVAGGKVGAPKPLHVRDLYLACACLHGDARAHAALESRFLMPLAARLAARKGGALADEILQETRTRMLLGQGQSPPRLAGYLGRGALTTWLKVAASRVAVDLVRNQRSDIDEDIDRTPLAAPTDDPETALVTRRTRSALARAVRDVLAMLAPRDAAVLRLHYLEGASVTQIAGRRGVTRRSVQHWLANARKNVFTRARTVLAERFPDEDNPLADLAWLARGPFDLNLEKALLRRGDLSLP
jgi:RNA polymerase sigma-70 factor (ECF subfamily)